MGFARQEPPEKDDELKLIMYVLIGLLITLALFGATAVL